MPRLKFALLFPIGSVVITSGLWFLARAQYLRFVCSPEGACPSGWGIPWSDYTPLPLIIGGMLNVPVATFANPLYHLMQGPAKTELFPLLGGVVILWGYIGWTIDMRNAAPLLRGILSKVVGAAGLLLGIFVLVATALMFHVGLIYKGVAVVWRVLDLSAFPAFLPRRTPESWVSGAGELHPRALAEPYMNLSAHTAPIAEPRRAPSCQ